MIILGLDLARNCGFAHGAAGTIPFSGTWDLRPPGGSYYDEPGALSVRLLDLARKRGRPDLIFVEEAMSPSRREGDHHAIMSQFMLHGAVLGYAGAARINVRREAPSTIRKQVIGRGSAGSKAETKRMVVETMKLLGLIPPDCTDDNRADACCAWRFAEDVVAQTRRLVLSA